CSGAGWPENHRGHGRRLRAPDQPAYLQPRTGGCTTADLASPDNLDESGGILEPPPPSKHETRFEYAARLIYARSRHSEDRSRDGIDGVDNGEVPAQKERIFSVRRGHGEGKSAAAGTVEQVDGSVLDAAGALDVFRPRRQRESSPEGASQQKCA